MTTNLSCSMLYQGLVLNMDSIQPCAPSHVRPTIPYDGGDFPLESFLQMRRKTQEEISQGISPCLDCTNLQEFNTLPNHKEKIRYIALHHGMLCNSRCIYCNFWHPENNQEKNRQRYSAIAPLSQLLALGFIHPEPAVDWGTGEPTILPEFEELLQFLDKNGFTNLVNSNCLRFSAALAHGLRDKATLQCSLDCSTPATFRKIKGSDNFFTVIENLRNYARINANNIILKYIVCRYNNTIQEIDGFLDLAEQLGIKRINISPEHGEITNNTITDVTLGATAYLFKQSKLRGFDSRVFDTCYPNPAHLQRIYA
ncbi:MAG: radical SAM protein [Deltaproteobacteria bacterium]|nr:radical SAM protein [Deltaproteobacteria bacterium]